MLIKLLSQFSRCGILFLIIYTGNLAAKDEYRGMIFAQIVEQNGNIFTGNIGFNSNHHIAGKQIIYFEQSSGQKVAVSQGRFLFDNSKDQKYHLVINNIQRESETFNTGIELFQNSLNKNSEGKLTLISNSLKKAEIVGQLYSRNEFLIVDDGIPNLNLTFYIDRIFSKQEIYSNLSKKLKDNTQQINK